MVQIMAWRRPGDKPLSEPMVHICVALPQWANLKCVYWTHVFGVYRSIEFFIFVDNKLMLKTLCWSISRMPLSLRQLKYNSKCQFEVSFRPRQPPCSVFQIDPSLVQDTDDRGWSVGTQWRWKDQTYLPELWQRTSGVDQTKFEVSIRASARGYATHQNHTCHMLRIKVDLHFRRALHGGIAAPYALVTPCFRVNFLVLQHLMRFEYTHIRYKNLFKFMFHLFQEIFE